MPYPAYVKLMSRTFLTFFQRKSLQAAQPRWGYVHLMLSCVKIDGKLMSSQISRG